MRQYDSTGRAIALSLAFALVAWLTKMFKLYVKVYKTLYFLNPVMDFVYLVWLYMLVQNFLGHYPHTCL